MGNVKQKYQFAVIATDVAAFAVEAGELKVLLIAMQKDPFRGQWALPGGLLGGEESAETAASRQLETKTGVTAPYMDQVRTFSEPNRDPFGRVVSVAYLALLPKVATKLSTTTEYGGVAWFPVSKLPELAYDHAKILSQAVDALKERIGSSNIAYSLLPERFTLAELQSLYESVLGHQLDKRNFRKKLTELKLFKKTGTKTAGGAHRPAELYRFSSTSPKPAEIIT